MGAFDDLIPGNKPPATSGAFDDLIPKEKPKAGMARSIADLGLGFASGAVGATKALADVAGANNAVSNTLQSIDSGINEYLSPAAIADQQEQAAIMKEAEGKGLLEGIKAGGRAFAVAPLQTSVTGLGSIAPIIAASALTGGTAAVPVGAAVGAAMGAGTVKGTIYEDVKKRGIAAGLSPEAASNAALRAQEYDGKNTGNIAAGAALGTVDALSRAGTSASTFKSGAGAVRSRSHANVHRPHSA